MKKRSEESVRLSRRMKPEERLVAHFRHSELVSRIYRAGVEHRKRSGKRK